MMETDAISVLVAEDDPLINQGTAKQLARLGYAVAGQAYDGPQAVEMARQEQPAVVLMDLQMIDPETGREDPQAGLKAAQQLKERCLAAVILLTAHESPELIRMAGEAGITSYLVKPAQDNELERAITIGRARQADLLELRRLASELQLHRDQLRLELSRVKAIRGWLSTCSSCRKVRDERGLWQPLELFVQDHSEARFTHGFCPDCFHELFPDIHADIR